MPSSTMLSMLTFENGWKYLPFTVRRHTRLNYRLWDVNPSSWTSRMRKLSRSSSPRTRMSSVTFGQLRSHLPTNGIVDIVVEMTEPFDNKLALSCLDALKSVSEQATLITVSHLRGTSSTRIGLMRLIKSDGRCQGLRFILWLRHVEGHI